MIGAIAGDIIGSVHECVGGVGGKDRDFEFFPVMFDDTTFTDDSVLTVATADVLLNPGYSYADAYRDYFKRYPNRGYGGSFSHWGAGHTQGPYNSWGNGSAMRVSPVSWVATDISEALRMAKQSAKVTHNHPEGIKGAQAVAVAGYMARKGYSPERIRGAIAGKFGYNMDRSVNDIRPGYRFDVSCQGSVPEAIICALESVSWEGAVRSAVSLGGDTDTQACMAGGIAEAMFGPVPQEIRDKVHEKLPDDLWRVVTAFEARYMGGA